MDTHQQIPPHRPDWTGTLQIGPKVADRGVFLLDGFVIVGQISDERDARRIIACVNACQGIPTQEMEYMAELGGIKQTYQAVTTQRDRLAEAVRKVAPLVDNWVNGQGDDERSDWEEALQELNAALRYMEPQS